MNYLKTELQNGLDIIENALHKNLTENMLDSRLTNFLSDELFSDLYFELSQSNTFNFTPEFL